MRPVRIADRDGEQTARISLSKLQKTVINWLLDEMGVYQSEMGFPLFGDRTYGDRADPVPVARHMLHASRLEFPHPTQPGRRLTVNCPLPADFRIALKELERLK